MIHVIQTIENQEYKLRDARFEKALELWVGDVVGKNVTVGISARLVRIVYYFKDEGAYDAYRRDQGVVSKTRGGSGLIQ